MPQLDVNVLIGLAKGTSDCVTYAASNQSAGLSYNKAAAAEFLTQGDVADLRSVERKYAITRIGDISLRQIETFAKRLQRAFRADSLGRTLGRQDARVAATAYLKKDALATCDLQFFKRGRDLGLQMEFVGSGAAARKAQAYAPKPVSVPRT